MRFQRIDLGEWLEPAPLDPWEGDQPAIDHRQHRFWGVKRFTKMLESTFARTMLPLVEMRNSEKKLSNCESQNFW